MEKFNSKIKTVADAKAAEIINARAAKIAEAKKEWLEAIKPEAKKTIEEIEAARLLKVKKIYKLNIKAYQVKPVKCIGKRGANWVFVSE